MSTIFPQVETFRLKLQKQNIDFVCNSQLPDTSAAVSFLGSFQGQSVLWNMTLATLLHFRATRGSNISVTESGLFNCPFIEIADGKEGVFQIQVGLDLAQIDEPVINKSIIMIRNYKRLAIGLTEFGSMHT
jgi:hypothetical protein